jgi:hypothetical protein
MGNVWRMPTSGESSNLLNSSYSDVGWAVWGNTNGRLYISKVSGYTDNTIFFPAAGYVVGGPGNQGVSCFNWTSSLTTDVQYCAWALKSSTNTVDESIRGCGMTIRGVWS